MQAPRELVRWAEQALSAAGIDNARAEVRWLLAAATGRSALSVSAVTDDEATAFTTSVGRRVRREPLQHVLGRAAFRHLDLRVGAGVFVPRPETELLVDIVLAELRQVQAAGRSAPIVVDLCSGSGAIAIAVATESPSSTVSAVELSENALVWLRANIAEQSPQVQGRLQVVPGDVANVTSEPAMQQLAGTVDVVVANPPYVPAATPVGPEVFHDPPEAVFAGADGLALMPALARLAAYLLRRGGMLAVEHSESHAAQLADDLRGSGWVAVEGRHDLAARPRFVTARRPST